MNPRGYFLLFQRREVLLWTSVSALLALPMLWLGRSSAPMEPGAFTLLILVVPLWLGAATAKSVQEVLHTTFSETLPGLRIVLQRWFVLSSAAASLAWVLVVHRSHLELPWLPAWMLAWLMMCLSVPSEPGGFAGSRIATVLVALAVGYVLFVAPWIQAMQAHPWLFGLAGGASAVGCLRLGFDRNRLRRRAGTPRPPSFDVEEDAVRQMQHLSRNLLAVGSASGESWSDTWLGNNPRAWTRAAWYENNGRRLLVLAALYPLFNLFAALLSAKSSPLGTAAYVFHSFVDPVELGQADHAPILFLIVLLVIVVSAAGTAGLRNDRVYPLSRRDRARVSFRSGLRFGLVLCATWCLLSLALVLAAKAVAAPPLRLPAVPWFVFELGALLSIFPLLQWGQLIPSRFGCLASLLIAIFVIPLLLAGLGLFFAARILGPPLWCAVATCTVLPLATHVLAWSWLRWHYARCDLVTAPP